MNEQNIYIRTKINNNSPKDILNPKLDSTVEFNLPDNSRVNLFLTDTNGNIISIINNKYLRKGRYSKKFDFTKLPIGKYYYKLKTELDEFTKELKLM
jgi:hypothetical protein